MPRLANPFIQFNASYYTYPNSVRSGKILVVTNLSSSDVEHQKQWLKRVAHLSLSKFHKIIISKFSDKSDEGILRSLLLQHGIFTEKFFHQQTRERVARRYAELSISLEEFRRLMSSAWGYNYQIYNKSDAIYQIIDHIFDQAIVRVISDPSVSQGLQSWFDHFSRPSRCVLCGNIFRTIDLPDWIYFGSNGCKTCCFQCRILGTPKKSDLYGLIPAFVEKCGFIPHSDANPINYAFTSRLSSRQWGEVFTAYAIMGGIGHVKKKFGSWFKALAETGALPDGVLPTARGMRCLAQDGHMCHSLDEQRIDDWLSIHHLLHEREPIYPHHTSLNPTGKRRADWKVRDTFIEYFGLIGDQNYEKKMDEKIFLAQEAMINLIAIYPYDLTNLDERLRCLLE